jgi:hypothetical protein
MSATTAPTGLDTQETIARINNLQADTAAKLAAAAKTATDTKLAGWQVAFAGFTSGAAVIGAIYWSAGRLCR